ncbi:MAG: TolC family outer membrane protein [Nitrospinae bacterium]|nr:TolC family outer membrane protein [Nitrospinota bacterium]MBF0633454.1 TolC family outer membrane protein [Nitrospinota bacterium]
MRLPLAICLSAAAGLISASSAAAGSLDIMSAYALARSSDPAYASAKAGRVAGEEKDVQGRALFLPSVGLSAEVRQNQVDNSYTTTPKGFALQGGSKSYDSEAIGVSLTQPLYRAQNSSNASQLTAVSEQSAVALKAAEQDLILRVAQAYFDILFAEDSVKFIASYKQAISEQLAQARRSFELGAATITDTHEAQARNDLAAAQEIAVRNDLAVKKDSLRRVIGVLPDSVAPLADNAPLERADISDEGKWIATAEKESPLVKSQRLILSIAQYEAEKSQAGHYPTLDAIASYSYSRASDGSLGAGTATTAAIIGAQLAVPLYQGGSVSSKAREAAALEVKAQSDLEAVMRQARSQVTATFVGVKNGLAQADALRQAVASSQKALDSTRKGFEVGVRTSVDVLNAQQQLHAARRDHAQARYNYILSVLRLKASAGILDDKDAEWVNSLLAKN